MNARARAVVLAVGLIETLIVYFHVLGIQENTFWRWPWRNGNAWPLFPALAICAVPGAVAVLRRRPDSNPRTGLMLLASSAVLFQLVGLTLAYHPLNPMLPAELVQDPFCTSFWYDARQLYEHGYTPLRMLREFPSLLPGFHVHARNKPPGYILFYLMLFHYFGIHGHLSGYIGAGLIALVVAGGVPATYWFAKEITGAAEPAFWAAAVFGLVPCVIAVYPQWDAAYPAWIGTIAVLWSRSLRSLRFGRIYAIVLGIVTTALLLLAYNLLVMGTFFLAMGAVFAGFGQTSGRRIMSSIGIAVGTFVAAYAALWLATGFNPVATFRAALVQQHLYYLTVPYPYFRALPGDFKDFLFGTGRMVVLIALGALLAGDEKHRSLTTSWLLRLCLLQIVLVGLSGILRGGESARLWIFLVPLLAIPAGYELARWPRGWRLAALAVMLLLLAAMLQNVEFNSLSPPWFS